MDAVALIDQTLEQILDDSESSALGEIPPQGITRAIRHAVLPGGGRIRPRLCLAVAQACGGEDVRTISTAAAAIELIHSASLVHDDLPCFDDAAVRRGRPSVQAQFGERLAVLAGDALIVLAFRCIATGAGHDLKALQQLIVCLGDGVGLPSGICAGQAWECEQEIDRVQYQRAKTGSLFAAATVSGAIAADYAAPSHWRALGLNLGEAYQVADDIHDTYGDPEKMGKPVGKDQELDRPSITRDMGLHGANVYLDKLVNAAVDSIPDCSAREWLAQQILEQYRRLLPPELCTRAA